MGDFDANSAECAVITYKEGLLSAVAHDLRIKVGRLSLKVAPGQVEGRFDARSLVVDAVVKDGRDAPGALGPRDLDKIAKSIREDVLAADRHPEIVFRAGDVQVAGERATLKGELTLVGRTRPLVVEAKRDGGKWVAEVVLHQPDFGIKPFSAMLGTLKIKPDVKVRVTVPADGLPVREGGA